MMCEAQKVIPVDVHEGVRKFQRVEIIEALAGSGKTQELTYRYLRLVAMGFDPKTILATTFSRKAAGEIRDRIIELLAEAILKPESLQSLLSGVPEIKGGVTGCETLLRQLVATLHRLNIGTIDSFFVKTAQSFSDTLGLSPNWSILDEVHGSEVFAEAVLRLTRDETKRKQLATLLRWSTSAAKVPVCKTIASLQLQAFKAVRDTESRAWLWGETQPVLSSSELGVAINVLELEKPELAQQQKDIHRAVEKLRIGDLPAFLKSGMASKILDGTLEYYKKEIDPNVVQSLQPLIDHALSVMANRLLEKNKGVYELMHELHACWVGVKHDWGVYSFDDVTYILSYIGLMKEFEELQFRMDSSIHHMLIDEFQDTSLTQWSVLKPLIDEIHQSDEDRSLFFVGDVKQSLYGFRGGEPALLKQLPERLIDSNTVKLEKSWRCSSPVLQAVNTIFEQIHLSELLVEHAPDAAQTWQEDYTHHLPARTDRKGYAVIQTAGVDPDQNKSQLALCVEEVAKIVSDIHQKAPRATIGILVRSNTKQQIQRIVHALRTKKEHPVRDAAEFGGNPLTDSPAVTVILSLLLMVDNPGHTVARFHVLNSPLGVHVGLKDTTSIREIEQVCKTIRRKLLHDGYSQVLSGYAEQLVGFVEERERLRLWQLIELAESYASEMTLRPSEFVRIVQDTQVPDPASSQVQVMTIHKSKGLSFDAVIVCDLDQPLWKAPKHMTFRGDGPCNPATCVGVYASEFIDYALPQYKDMRNELHNRQINDVMCLLYVAMTRAKHALHIVIPSRTSKKHLKKLDSLLLQAVQEPQAQEPNKIIWMAEGSDATWCSDINKDEIEESPDPLCRCKIQFNSESTQDFGSSVASTSPSSLEGGGKIHIAQRFAGGTNDAFSWGTVVHYWFEQLEWLDSEIPSVTQLVASAPREEAELLGEDQLALAASSFIKAFEHTPLHSLFTKTADNVSVFREQTFVVRVPKGTQLSGVKLQELSDIRGSIDRLVVFRDEAGHPVRAEVIDWKTDQFEDSELDQKVAHYAPQLASYRLAAARLLGIDVEAVTAILAFVSRHDVRDITEKASVVLP